MKVYFLLAAAMSFGLNIQAAPTFYTSQANFDAAVSGLPSRPVADSFEDLPQGWVFGPLDRGAFSLVNGGNQVFVVDNLLDATDGSKALVMGVPSTPATFTFEAPIVAFSIDISDVLSILGGDLTVEIDGGPAQAVLSGLFGSRNKQFIGMIDTANPFTSLTFNNTDVADTWTFDRARYVSAPAATPEPGTWILFCTGVAGLWFCRHGRLTSVKKAGL